MFIEYHPPNTYNSFEGVSYAKRRRDFLESVKRDEPLIILLSLRDVRRFIDFITSKLELDKGFINRFIV